MDPFISVVITAHNRKKYLLNAVKSVLNQDSSRSYYEIIVIKNFTDEVIDTFLKRERVTCFYTDEQSFGAKLAIGIDNSKGEVISFLDDDDEFSFNKISGLIEVFKDKNIIYHHSSISAIDELGNEYVKGLSTNIPKTVIKKYFDSGDFKLVMKYKLDWYMSAISCRASLLRSNLCVIRRSFASLDKITFLLSVESGGSLYFDSRHLTRYRVHESLTTRFTNRNDFLRARNEFYLRSLKSLQGVLYYFNNHVTKYLIEWEITHGKLLVYFFSDDVDDMVHTSSLIKYAILSLFKRLNVITYWSLLDIIRKVVPDIIRSSFYKKSTRKFNDFIPQ